jgi:hypothetical protein
LWLAVTAIVFTDCRPQAAARAFESPSFSPW